MSALWADGADALGLAWMLEVQMKKYRLAMGADGVERPWTKDEKFMLYMRGWRDGAGQRAMREEVHLTCPEYDTGYADGYEARQRASQRAAKRLKYKPSILRLAKGKNDGTRQRQR
jgi:hypothetical protein